MNNLYGAVCGMGIVRENQSRQRKPAPEPLCPEILLDFAWDRTRPWTWGWIMSEKLKNNLDLEQ
jgi:hypothetical protein